MQVYKLLRRYLQELSEIQIILFFILSITSIIISIIMPYLNGKLLDYITMYKDMNYVIRFSLIIAFLSIMGIIISYCLNILQINIQTNLAFNFNIDMIKHMQKIPLLILEEYDTVYLNQRINSHVNEISSFF